MFRASSSFIVFNSCSLKVSQERKLQLPHVETRISGEILLEDAQALLSDMKVVPPLHLNLTQSDLVFEAERPKPKSMTRLLRLHLLPAQCHLGLTAHSKVKTNSRRRKVGRLLAGLGPTCVLQLAPLSFFSRLYLIQILQFIVKYHLKTVSKAESSCLSLHRALLWRSRRLKRSA